VVVSLFVNPAQFSEADDLSRYPRDEAGDARVADAAGVDVLFAPSEAELYPPGFATWVEPTAAAEGLEGTARPGHFRGVATVCTKLFGIVSPHTAFFGRKDAQQVAVVRQVVRDLNLAVEVVAVPTVRDADGLALSSRNRFLSADERARAVALPRALDAGAAAHRSGRDAVEAARASLAETPDVAIDYVELADLDGPTLVAAVRIGSTRLIDNVALA
jgi:pantoate--beta-alanine ligase